MGLNENLTESWIFKSSVPHSQGVLLLFFDRYDELFNDVSFEKVKAQNSS